MISLRISPLVLIGGSNCDEVIFPLRILQCRWLATHKVTALKAPKSILDKFITLTVPARKNIGWWLLYLPHSCLNIDKAPNDQTIYSDAYLLAWGAAIRSLTNVFKWSYKESQYRINNLELLAVHFAIKRSQFEISDR